MRINIFYTFRSSTCSTLPMELEGGVNGEEGDEIPVAVGVRVAPPPHAFNNPFTPPPPLCVQVNPLTNELYLGMDRTFSFDYIYGPNSYQDEVFASSTEPLLTPYLDGYNVSVILYGASDTGKTFSLVGPDNIPALNEENFGIVPRLVRALFRALDEQRDTSSVIEVSYVEIYNEEIRDLLSDNLSGVFLDNDPLGNFVLSGVNTIECGAISEVLACLEMGQSLHKSGSLNIFNTMAHGSHTIFNIKLKQQTVSGGCRIFKQSNFQFVDLAPSDKLTAPNGAINLGLLALGNVVSALGDPRRNVSYVPYQDSILSKLLAPALGGNCVTLLLCCISSLAQDSEESLNSLLFACRAANIKNTPMPNIVREEFSCPNLIMSPITSPVHTNQYYNTLPSQYDSRRNSSCSVNLYPNTHNFQSPNSFGQPQSFQSPNPIQYSHLPKFSNQFSPNQIPMNYCNGQGYSTTTPHHTDYNLQNNQQLSPNYNIITGRTTPGSTSPLSHKSNAALNLYLPYVPNNSSINESVAIPQQPTPMIGNQGHMILRKEINNESNLTEPRPASQNLIQDGLLDPGNEEMFKLQFAASQYKALVSNAEDLLHNISLNEETHVTEKKEIEVWMCKKEESEQAIKKSGDTEKVLAKILEESEDETEESSVKTDTESSDRVLESETASLESVNMLESIEEFDSECSDMSDVESKLEIIEYQFRQITDSLADEAEVCYWNQVNEETLVCVQLEKEAMKGETHRILEESNTILEKDLIDFRTENDAVQCQPDIASQIRKLSDATESQRGQVKIVDEDMNRVKIEMEDLKNVIKSKEAYIKDLLNTGKESEQAKANLEEKLKRLEKESNKTQRDLMSAQIVLKDLESKAGNSVLELEYRSKVNNYKTQIEELKQKVKDTEQILCLTQPESTKILELQENLLLLKEQHERLKQKLSDEQDRKRALENALFEDQEIIKDLKAKLTLQEKLLTESVEATKDINLKKQWLLQEEKRIVEMEFAAKQLQETLIKREENMMAKENEFQETSFITGDVVELQPTNLNTYNVATIRNEIKDLRAIRDVLVRERQEIDGKLQYEKSLSSKEERKLVELDESVEAIDSAIEYKNDILCNKNVVYNKTYDGDDVLMKRLVKLNVEETRALLHRYFVRVLDLRTEGRKMELRLEDIEEQYHDLEKYARDIVHKLNRAKLECENRLVTQHREYQGKINLLLQQSGERPSQEYIKKMKSLEKDVHHYKKLCKELKRGHEADARKIACKDEIEAGYESSRPDSVVSHIQPSHMEQFQRRLAKMQKKMGETAKPTVTREHRKIIIENPISTNNSVEKKTEKHSRRKR